MGPNFSYKKRKKTVSSLKKQLDAVFSQWIRLLYSTEDGMVSCFTCGARMHWKKIQNGHYTSRQYNAGRYEPRNCRPQCYSCNYLHRGNYSTYSLNLIKERGVDEIEYLESLKRITKQFFVPELEELIAKYKILVKDLLKKISTVDSGQ